MLPHRLLSLKAELIHDDVLDPAWLCHCFDHAVMWFGRHIENKLLETDKTTHEPLHTLDELLDATPRREMDSVRQLISMFGFIDKR